MKLSCTLVEDLYPLYEENEVSESSRLAIENHLRECEKCHALYQQGTSFSDLPLSSLKEAEMTNKMDDRIRLRLKLMRMRMIALLFGAIIIVAGIQNYAANREKIADLLNGAYQYGELLKEIGENPYEMGMNREMMSYPADDIIDLENELYWFDRDPFSKAPTPILVNTQEFDQMIAKLKQRKEQGLEDERDQKAKELLRTYTDSLFTQIQAEYDQFHHGYSSYFELFDLKAYSKPIRQINDLAYLYSKYHRVPTEMKLLSEPELEKVIGNALEMDTDELELKKSYNRAPGVFTFELQVDNIEINGEIDGYTGILYSFSSQALKPETSHQISKAEAEKKAMRMVENIYGEPADFASSYEKITENMDLNSEIHRFKLTPKSGSDKLLFQSRGPFFIDIEAETGLIRNLSFEPAMDLNGFFAENYQQKFEPNALMSKAESISKEEIEYIETGIIYSTVSAKYVLVHVYKGPENWVYVNAETGIIEQPFVSGH